MSRSLQINLHTTAVILIVVSWLSCAPVLGFPAASRATAGESMSARRRGGDGLIVGSDFLDMFIGAKVDPTVRSRRYPLVRADIVEPAQEQGQISGDAAPTPSSDVNDQNRRNNNNNADLSERLSGLVRSQDRQNYHFENQDLHNSNKVEHLDDLPRRGVRKLLKNVHPSNRLRERVVSTVTDDAVIRGVLASESRVFGGRTLPRTSSSPPSRDESVTDASTVDAGRDHHRATTEADELAEDATGSDNEGQTQRIETGDVIDDLDDETQHLNAAPKFSVSSSVHIVTTKENEKLDSETLQKNEIPTSKNDDLFTSPDYRTVTDIVTSKDDHTLSTQDDFTSSVLSSTESPEFSTEGDSTTQSTTAVVDFEQPTERTEDWSDKLEDITSEPIVRAEVEEIPDVAQFQKVGIPQDRHETAIQVVSVRVSSSVAQSPPASRAQGQEATLKKNAISNTISEEPTPIVNPSSPSKSQPESASLETVDLPPTTSLQRSELLVEESSPSEVTADPNTSYASFLSSNYPSSATNYYQNPSEQTSAHPHANPRRRVQFFNHPPTNHRNPTIEALRRSAEDSPSQLNGFVKASIENISPRRYAAHSLPRSQDSHSIFQSLRKEPDSVAESIQRSIIASQDPDRLDTRSGSIRSQFHQDKNRFSADGYQGDSRSYPDQKAGSDIREKSYGEPYTEKSYGEPERVWGEPEKVYGEPEREYGQQQKVFGEPAKNYEVDEAVSVMTNGRAHGVQPSPESTQSPTQTDSALKMLDSKQQDPNHKFGYVVEGRNFRKYRVEERTSDGFIVGEYGVVSHDDGSLRGVRYTADESINPRLIYDTLVKFLSL